jgi:outer membrane receptor protein involved in Fe transport
MLRIPFGGGRIVWCAAFVLAAWPMAFAQNSVIGANAGQLSVQVKDPSGAAMQASGTLSGVGAGRSFQTDAQGAYTFSNLAAGRYRLEVSKSGFATELSVVDIAPGAAVSQTVTLELATQVSAVDVVSATPLPGTELPIDQIAAPVQTLSARELEQSGSLDLSDVLNRRLGGVNVNENQGNPFQADVNFRGYTASPLLGTPQGISVYVDGVRQNQPFGDVVSWDLIPKVAIADMALIPGSNPVFGLNTQGGALSVETKDGHSAPGTSISASGGSFGRRAVEFEHGGSWSSGPAWRQGLHWYFAGNLFHEDGWRIASPSDVRQVFGKIGKQSATTSMALSFAYAGNKLIGNGLQQEQLLSRDYTSAYTLGDVTANHSPSFNLSARHALSTALTFTGNAYFRYIRADTVNTNLNENSLDQSVYQPSGSDQAALKAVGYTGYPTAGATAANTPFPYWRCIAQALRLADPSSYCDGIIAGTFARQNNYGLSGQFTWIANPRGHRNQFTAGAAWDRSSLTFSQTAQFAYINPDRTMTPVNAFADGSTSSDGSPVDSRVNLHGLPQTWGLYATDTMTLGKAWSLTLAGRCNRTTIDNRDRIDPGGGPGSLDGQYVFGRMNPAIGLTYNPFADFTAYASYSESSRAPTSIELGCADPNNPCSLPNAVTSDPALQQVITRTFEAGVRGGRETDFNWSAGWFHGENHNDLLFVASQQTGNGYFKNFGQTLRQGAELHVGGRVKRVSLGGNYTFVRATYETAEVVDGSSNSTNDAALAGSRGLGGVVQILPGDRIPLTPEHMFKAFADAQIGKKVSVDVDFTALSSSFARGNENNLSGADGLYYLGPGTSPGYGVVNLGAHYQLAKRVQFFGEIKNLLDHHYYTAAQLAVTGFTNAGTFLARPLPAVNGNFPLIHATFYAPGAPFGAWGGVRVTF